MSTEKGVKLDNGKLRLGLVFGGFATGLKEVGAVGTFGANKYTDNGWQTVPDGVERYKDALFRHLFAWLSGEETDEESGCRHLAHAAWNCLALLTLTHKSEYLLYNRSSELASHEFKEWDDKYLPTRPIPMMCPDSDLMDSLRFCNNTIYKSTKAEKRNGKFNK